MTVFDDTDVRVCSGPRCHARICWTVTEDGKRQPVDVDPNPSGNLVVEKVARYSYRSHVETLLDPAGDRYVPHHATCPDVELFR